MLDSKIDFAEEILIARKSAMLRGHMQPIDRLKLLSEKGKS